MPRRIGRLYHLAEASNMPSILAHGLLSTRDLMALAGVDDAERRLRIHRPGNVALSPDILIRDQKPMPPAALAPALTGGLAPGDWYALLNGFVFLWPDYDRLLRQRGAVGSRRQIVLTFDADVLLDAFGAAAKVSPINSGNARRRPSPRGYDTFVPYRRWRDAGWSGGRRGGPPAELVLPGPVPVTPPYLINAEPL